MTNDKDRIDYDFAVDATAYCVQYNDSTTAAKPTPKYVDLYNTAPEYVDESDDYLKVNLLTHTPNAKRVAFAAIRSCYSPGTAVNLFTKEFDKYENSAAKPSSEKDGASSCSEGASDADRLIREIWKSGHTSTLEHITFTFSIENLSRAALSQLTRHRIGWSYSVQSQRYVKQNSDSRHGEAGFVYPECEYLDNDTRDAAGQLFAEAVNQSQGIYDALVGLGVHAEDARAVLGMNSTCNLVVTCNVRSFFNAYNVRKPGTHAQGEIQQLFQKMYEIIMKEEPWLHIITK